AAQAVDAALQAQSDELEGWAAALGDDAPPARQRAEWLRSVGEQLTEAEPQPVLAGLLRDTWLAPRTAALRERAAVHEYRATERQRTGRERDDQAAEQLLGEREPVASARFTRRTRPPAGPDGTPLWRLLGPREGLGPKGASPIAGAPGGAR